MGRKKFVYCEAHQYVFALIWKNKQFLGCEGIPHQGELHEYGHRNVICPNFEQ